MADCQVEPGRCLFGSNERLRVQLYERRAADLGESQAHADTWHRKLQIQTEGLNSGDAVSRFVVRDRVSHVVIGTLRGATPWGSFAEPP